MRRAVVTGVALAVLLLAAACAPKPRIQDDWPRVDSEREVSGPSSAAVWPLTGKPAVDETAAASAPVMLAVSDVPAAASLPGLDSADLVLEVAAGGTDRISALFQSSLPAAAGPLREAGGEDRSLADAFGARLFGSKQVKAGLADVASLASAPSTIPAPGAKPAFSFGSETASAAPAVRITVPLAGGSKVDWHYDEGSGSYQRFVDAKPALAQGTRLIRAVNVVVMWVAPEGWPAAASGTGRVSVFSGGSRVAGSWEASGSPPAFHDEAGSPIRLQPGNTWVEIVPASADILLR